MGSISTGAARSPSNKTRRHQPVPWYLKVLYITRISFSVFNAHLTPNYSMEGERTKADRQREHKLYCWVQLAWWFRTKCRCGWERLGPAMRSFNHIEYWWYIAKRPETESWFIHSALLSSCALLRTSRANLVDASSIIYSLDPPWWGCHEGTWLCFWTSSLQLSECFHDKD